MFIGEDGLDFSHLTDEFKNRMIARIHKVVAESQARADALMTEHQDALVVVATAVYQHPRLTDERLATVLRAAGFTWKRTLGEQEYAEGDQQTDQAM